MKKLKVLGFFAGPSAGKTTNALLLAGHMKARRYDVAYVPEFPLECVQDKRWVTLDNQAAVFGEQMHRLYRCIDDFEYVVTDAPLFMQMYYLEQAQKRFPVENLKYWKLTMEDLIMQSYEMFENYNYFVDRGDREYRQAGRTQTKEESLVIDVELLALADRLDIDYKRLTALDAWSEALDDLDARGITRG